MVGDWSFAGSDMVLNEFRHVDRRHAVDVARRFTEFVIRTTSQHPCRIPKTNPLPLASSSDKRVLHLPHGWWVFYDVEPNCEAEAGTVRFQRVGRTQELTTL